MQGKVAIITGASSGIGRALAFALGQKGVKVVITGRKPEPLEQTRAELEKNGIEAQAIVADSSQEADNARMIEATLQHFGKIDLLICNAGISMRALVEDLDLSVIRQVMDINFYGTVYAIKYALPHLLASQGTIVGISSIAGFRGLPARSGYSASKFAMHGFLEALRTELLRKKVHVLIACPGFTQSNIRRVALTKDGKAQGETPRDEGAMMSAEAVAAYIVRAMEKKRRYLVLTRQGKFTVFLNKWWPALMDKLVYKALAREANSPLQ
ncbi:MAG: SDR family oxidoreductase [Microscillaceae bacterium]